MDRTLIDNLFESSVRAETIVHIGTMALQESWPDAVREAFEDDLVEMTDVLPLQGIDATDKDEIIDLLGSKGVLGWLVKFSTPIPTQFYKSGYSFSWGLYTSEWFYGEDFEALCEKALKWKDSIIVHYREKWEKESEATA